MERSFSQTFESLRHQQNQLYSELLFTAENLLLYASSWQNDEQQQHLHLFTDTPQLTQAVWRNDSDSQHHHTTVGITVFEDGLIIGVRGEEPSKPQQHVTVGPHYANYSETGTTRPGIYERPLDSEHLMLFSDSFASTTARLGLTGLVKSEREVARAA